MIKFDLVLEKCNEAEMYKKQEQMAYTSSRNSLNQAVREARKCFGIDSLSEPRATVLNLNRFTDHNMSELFEHWNVYLASMVTVKHTVKLNEDYSVNHLFGLKIHRSHSSYNIFRNYSGIDFPSFKDGILIVSNSEVINLITLLKHKNIDQEKVPLLLELTRDICSLLFDRKIILTDEVRKAIQFVKNVNSDYYTSNFYEDLKSIEKHYLVYSTVVNDLDALNERRRILEDKWNEINKNYKLLIKLSSKQLRV